MYLKSLSLEFIFSRVEEIENDMVDVFGRESKLLEQLDE